jgi:3'(2'), 5'-bisphosphate nucleotidase
MQWDTAAGHIIALEAGASVQFTGINSQVYQREQLRNPDFIVSARPIPVHLMELT